MSEEVSEVCSKCVSTMSKLLSTCPVGYFFLVFSARNLFIFFGIWVKHFQIAAIFLDRCVKTQFYVSSGTIQLSFFWIGILEFFKKIQNVQLFFGHREKIFDRVAKTAVSVSVGIFWEKLIKFQNFVLQSLQTLTVGQIFPQVDNIAFYLSRQIFWILIL